MSKQKNDNPQIPSPSGKFKGSKPVAAKNGLIGANHNVDKPKGLKNYS